MRKLEQFVNLIDTQEPHHVFRNANEFDLDIVTARTLYPTETKRDSCTICSFDTTEVDPKPFASILTEFQLSVNRANCVKPKRTANTNISSEITAN
jgi:2-iminoacetate synthase ThiH